MSKLNDAAKILASAEEYWEGRDVEMPYRSFALFVIAKYLDRSHDYKDRLKMIGEEIDCLLSAPAEKTLDDIEELKRAIANA